jgi:hypothetical protein
MKPRAIEVQIDELIAGLSLGPVDTRRMAAGLESELGRLLMDRAPSAPVAVDRIRAGQVEIRQGARPADIGAAIARSVHGAISAIAPAMRADPAPPTPSRGRGR